jgi:hypothetical protein
MRAPSTPRRAAPRLLHAARDRGLVAHARDVGGGKAPPPPPPVKPRSSTRCSAWSTVALAGQQKGVRGLPAASADSRWPPGKPAELRAGGASGRLYVSHQSLVTSVWIAAPPGAMWGGQRRCRRESPAARASAGLQKSAPGIAFSAALSVVWEWMKKVLPAHVVCRLASSIGR